MNKNIIDQFKLLEKQIEFDLNNATAKEQNKHTFRLLQIKKITKLIEEFPDKITSSKQLLDIKGIGKGTLSRIDEILETGKLSEIIVTENNVELNGQIDELKSVIGIGRKKAIELIKKHNITSVEQLRKAVEKHEIELPTYVAKGLYYHDKYHEKIPRSEMLEYQELFTKTLKEIDTKLVGTMCGSFRRQKPTSNDIDLLIVHKDIIKKKQADDQNYLERVLAKLVSEKIIVDSLTGLDVQTKFMGFCQLPGKLLRRIDIRFLPYESLYPAMLYFTGSGDFNKRMRTIAIQKGYLLSEYGLFKKFSHKKYKRIHVDSEEQIFETLGMDYVPPEKRS